MEVLHIPEWRDDAIADIDIALLPVDGALEGVLEYWQVLRGEEGPNQLCRNSCPGFDLEDPALFLGPVVLFQQQIRAETARLTHPLGFGETKERFLNLRFSSRSS